jgi:hypothetical protein
MSALNPITINFASYEPVSNGLLIATAFLPLIISYALFYTLIKFTPHLKLHVVGILSFIPLILGTILGYNLFSNIFDPIYVTGFYIGLKATILHAMAFVVPVLGIIGLAIWVRILKTQREMDEW